MAGLRPGHPRLSCASEGKAWIPGFADKFTLSAQARLSGLGHDELHYVAPFHWLQCESDSRSCLRDGRCTGCCRLSRREPVLEPLNHDKKRRNEQHGEAGGSDHAAEYGDADRL